MEADLVKREGIPFEAVDAAGLHGVGLRALPGNLLRMGRGVVQSRRILSRFQPDALLFTGGFVAGPVAAAARVSAGRPPVLVYVPDIEPGLALKFLARIADAVAVTTPESRAYFPGKRPEQVRVTGYPVRGDLHTWDLDAARQTLSLSPDLPCLLVMGGSSGARGINLPLLDALPELLQEMQIVHLSGRLDWPRVEAAQAGLSPELAGRYHPYAYLHSEQVGAAFTAADLVVSRAGASILGELPLFALPAVLVPYPYAWRYQQVNAEYLAGKGAAIVLQETELPERLGPLVKELLGDESRRRRMSQAMGALAHPQAAEKIADILIQLANRQTNLASVSSQGGD